MKPGLPGRPRPGARLLALLAVVGLATGMAGCGGSAAERPRPRRAAAPPQPPPRPPSPAPVAPEAAAVQPGAAPPSTALEYQPPAPLPPFSRDELDRIYRVQAMVREASRRHRIPVDLVNGIIWVESRFQIRARSRKGPRGLMQIMPRTGRWLAKELGLRYSGYEARFSIHAGTYYFALMLKRFHGNLALALAAYNGGPGAVDGWIERKEPLPEQIKVYINDVLTAADTFRIRRI